MPMIVVNRPFQVAHRVECTNESHAILRSFRATFVQATIFAGWQEDEKGSYFELRRCRGCGSTLSDGTRKPGGLDNRVVVTGCEGMTAAEIMADLLAKRRVG